MTIYYIINGEMVEMNHTHIIHAVQDELATVSSKLAAEERRSEELEAYNSNLTIEIEALRAEQTGFENELERRIKIRCAWFRTENEKLHADLTRVRADFASVQNDFEKELALQVKDRCAELRAENEELRVQNSVLRSKTDTSQQSTIDSLQAHLARSQSTVNDLLNSTHEIHETRNDALEAHRKIRIQHVACIVELLAECARRRGSERKAQTRMLEAQAELESANETIEKFELALGRLCATLDE